MTKFATEKTAEVDKAAEKLKRMVEKLNSADRRQLKTLKLERRIEYIVMWG